MTKLFVFALMIFLTFGQIYSQDTLITPDLHCGTFCYTAHGSDGQPIQC